jgi:nucleoid-associated protein YgaU
MSKTALIGGPQVLAAAVVAVALAAVGALAIITGKTPEAPAPLAALPAPVESAPAAAPAPAPAEPVAAPAVEAPQERAMPAFDVVRVDAEGNATIAGRAEAGDQVALLLDGLEIAKAAADGAGAFVFLTTLPPADVPRSLSLQATGADGAARVSDVEAIVAPFAGPVAVAAAEAEAAKPEEAATEAAPETTAETAAAAGEASESAATAEVAAAGSTTAEAAASAVDKPLAAPAVVMAGPQGIEVKQAASVADSLAIDAISYTDTGDVEIAGRAPGRGFVRLYLDNKAVTESKIAEDGTWRTALTSVEAGIYTLRVDEVDSAGKVVSRVETPFRREAPEVLAKLTKAQAAETQGAETQGAATQGAETQTTEAQTAEAQTAEAQTAEAQATEPQATEPQAAGAQATEAQAAGMPATETQATETQATETQATEPQAAGTQAAETQAAGTQPKQASATAAAAAPQPAPKRVQAITVQPGNTLWAIARERYGSGMLYVRLFDANKDAIRDPDLIYPGQVFTIPD